MPPNSTTVRSVRKSSKPPKPYDGFPLFAHASGRWAKKIGGKFCYFGRWANHRNGELIRTNGDGWREALGEYKHQADDLHAGRGPEMSGDGCELRRVLNSFLSAKKDKLDNGELSPQTFSDYRVTCDKLVAFFGRTRHVDKLRPTDFSGFRASLARDMSIVTLKNEVNRARIIFKFAHDQRLIREPVFCGQNFDKPSALMLRKARNEAGPKLFTRDELKQILGGRTRGFARWFCLR